MRILTHQFSLVVAISIVSWLLGACGSADGKKAAEAVLARHFRAIATNGIDTALSDYDALFYQKTPKEAWRRVLIDKREKLGAYQSHTVSSWRVFKDASTDSVVSVSLRCQVVYSQHTATEVFMLLRNVSDSRYKILRHQINTEEDLLRK